VDRGIGEDIAIRFPAGRYRFDHSHRFRELDRVGIIGEPGATFIPPSGFNDFLLDFDGGWVLLTGITVDLSASDTTAGLRLITRDGFALEDVEIRGRGTHPDESVVNALALAVSDSSSRGTVRNVVARRGSAIGQYKNGNGRVGIWIGEKHRGRIEVDECRLEEFGNNGMYASRCPGEVHVRNGEFRNNSPSSVRIGGAGSFVESSTFVANLDSYSGPTTEIDAAQPRAIVIERGPFQKPPGAEVRDCTIRIENTPPPAPGIHVWPTGQTVTVQNTTFDVTHSGSVIHRTAMRRQEDHPPADGPRWVKLENVTVRGTGGDGAIIQLYDAPQSVIRDCQIASSPGRYDGIHLIRSDESTIGGGDVRTPGYPVVITRDERNPDACLLHVANRPNLDFTGQPTCPLPEASSVESGDTEGMERCSYNLFTKRLPMAGGETCIGTLGEFLDGGGDVQDIALTEVEEDGIRGIVGADR
jgi:hypothetical protein